VENWPFVVVQLTREVFVVALIGTTVLLQVRRADGSSRRLGALRSSVTGMESTVTHPFKGLVMIPW
jgi:hypothetical protein